MKKWRQKGDYKGWKLNNNQDKTVTLRTIQKLFVIANQPLSHPALVHPSIFVTFSHRSSFCSSENKVWLFLSKTSTMPNKGYFSRLTPLPNPCLPESETGLFSPASNKESSTEREYKWGLMFNVSRLFSKRRQEGMQCTDNSAREENIHVIST